MQVIFNADDFGCSSHINQAVIRAHREGVLTSASLMITGDAVDEAVALARETPTLAIGLHLVLVAGRPASPPSAIPHLVDRRGHLLGDPVRAGVRYFLSRRAQEELHRELVAQFERFTATGLPLSHVDSHLHFHMHPRVFDLLVPLAERYGARGLRLPRDDLWLSLRYDRDRIGVKVLWALFFRGLCARAMARLRYRHLVVAQRVYGLMQSGRMEEAYVAEVLRRLRAPSAELYFHPTLGPERDPWGPNPGDLATLLSPRIRRIIEERGLRLATYATLGEV